jgi:hypothetical protein
MRFACTALVLVCAVVFSRGSVGANPGQPQPQVETVTVQALLPLVNRECLAPPGSAPTSDRSAADLSDTCEFSHLQARRPVWC